MLLRLGLLLLLPVSALAQDSYYRDQKDLPREQRREINYDHPDAFDWALMIEQLRRLRRRDDGIGRRSWRTPRSPQDAQGG